MMHRLFVTLLLILLTVSVYSSVFDRYMRQEQQEQQERITPTGNDYYAPSSVVSGQSRNFKVIIQSNAVMADSSAIGVYFEPMSADSTEFNWYYGRLK